MQDATKLFIGRNPKSLFMSDGIFSYNLSVMTLKL
jgi:hypothetical protein